MPRFLFRAQAALDLRRRQDEDAQRARAAASAAVAHARAATTAADRALAEALNRARESQGPALQAPMLIWHHNWIQSRHRLAADSREVLTARCADEQMAVARAREARTRLRALERLRERAWLAHRRAVDRAEQQMIDELATLRHATPRCDAQGD